jgi:hypothetical protein
MEIYELTDKGKYIAHSYRSPRTTGWNIVHFLSRSGSASSEKILTYVPDATPTTLIKLRNAGIIKSTAGVSI